MEYSSRKNGKRLNLKQSLFKIYQHRAIGTWHPVYCEDFLICEQPDEDFLVGAVMDGCSSGADSHFASALFGKLLRKAANQIFYQEFVAPSLKFQKATVEEISKIILQRFFKDVKAAQQQFFLNRNELLTTLSVFFYQKSTNTAFVLSSGDGVIVLNDKIDIIDQNNRPNYLAYHLESGFEHWWTRETKHWNIEEPKRIVLATDGIESFRHRLKKSDDMEVDVIQYLLIDSEYRNIETMLRKKCLILEEDYDLSPADDLAIIRVDF